MIVIPASYMYEGRRVKSSKQASVTRIGIPGTLSENANIFTFFHIMYFQLHPDPPTSLPIQLSVISLLKELKSNNKNKNQNIQTKKGRN